MQAADKLLDSLADVCAYSAFPAPTDSQEYDLYLYQHLRRGTTLHTRLSYLISQPWDDVVPWHQTSRQLSPVALALKAVLCAAYILS